jgi:hypothetical protein
MILSRFIPAAGISVAAPPFDAAVRTLIYHTILGMGIKTCPTRA